MNVGFLDFYYTVSKLQSIAFRQDGGGYDIFIINFTSVGAAIIFVPVFIIGQPNPPMFLRNTWVGHDQFHCFTFPSPDSEILVRNGYCSFLVRLTDG